MKRNKNPVFILSLPGRWDQDYWWKVWPASVPLLTKYQSHRASSRELPGCREHTANKSKGILDCFSQSDESDGQGILQYRAQCRVQVETDIPFCSVVTSYHKLMLDVSFVFVCVCRLHSFSMQTANPSEQGDQRAPAVEICSCPAGYAGTSCEVHS